MASPSLATTTPNGTTSSATEAVKGAINDLIQVLDDETLKQPEQAEERRHEIEEIIKHRVDYEEMARRALGAHWSTLSHRDQHEFVDLFVQLLRDTFVGRITEHSDEQVVFLEELRRGYLCRSQSANERTEDRHAGRLSADPPRARMACLRRGHRWSQHCEQLPLTIH